MGTRIKFNCDASDSTGDMAMPFPYVYPVLFNNLSPLETRKLLLPGLLVPVLNSWYRTPGIEPPVLQFGGNSLSYSCIYCYS